MGKLISTFFSRESMTPISAALGRKKLRKSNRALREENKAEAAIVNRSRAYRQSLLGSPSTGGTLLGGPS